MTAHWLGVPRTPAACSADTCNRLPLRANTVSAVCGKYEKVIRDKTTAERSQHGAHTARHAALRPTAGETSHVTRAPLRSYLPLTQFAIRQDTGEWDCHPARPALVECRWNTIQQIVYSRPIGVCLLHPSNSLTARETISFAVKQSSLFPESTCYMPDPNPSTTGYSREGEGLPRTTIPIPEKNPNPCEECIWFNSRHGRVLSATIAAIGHLAR